MSWTSSRVSSRGLQVLKPDMEPRRPDSPCLSPGSLKWDERHDFIWAVTFCTSGRPSIYCIVLTVNTGDPQSAVAFSLVLHMWCVYRWSVASVPVTGIWRIRVGMCWWGFFKTQWSEGEMCPPDVQQPVCLNGPSWHMECRNRSFGGSGVTRRFREEINSSVRLTRHSGPERETTNESQRKWEVAKKRRCDGEWKSFMN